MESVPRGEAHAGRLRSRRPEAPRGLGKLVGLERLLNEHGDAIEADLLRFYRIDLLDFYRGTLSPRRLNVLIRWLPSDAATRRSQGEERQWGPVEHRLADLWALIWFARFGDPRDHPARAKLTAAANAAAQAARHAKKRALFKRRQAKYRKGGNA